MSNNLTLNKEELIQQIQTAYRIYARFGDKIQKDIEAKGNVSTIPEYEQRLRKLQEDINCYHELCEKEMTDILGAANSIFDFDADLANIVQQSNLTSQKLPSAGISCGGNGARDAQPRGRKRR